MKRFIITCLVAALIPLIGYCTGNERVLADIASRYDVASVYIGKAALQMAGSNMLAGKIGGKNQSEMKRIGESVKELESVEIVSCDRESVIPELRKEVAALENQLNLEMLIDTRESDKITVVYRSIPHDDADDVIDSLLIETNDGGNYCLIFIKGRIELSKLYQD